MLEIDLSNEKAEEVDLSDYVDFIGGRGLGAVLLREGNPKAEPFSHENSVFVLTSVLVGILPAVNRTWVVTISPLTNTYTCSSAGGYFSYGLRRSGFEVIKIYGRSDRPVYVEVDDGKVRFHSAEKLWGLGNFMTVSYLKERHKGEVLSIGPAGENLVRFASTQFDLHTAGRGGHGAVLGWKRIKAIVVRGKREIRANGEIKKVSDEILDRIRRMRDWAERGGTLSLTPVVNSAHAYPTDNWRRSHFEFDMSYGRIRGFVESNHTCYNCPLRCGKLVKTDFGLVDGPEYEIVWAFGANCNQPDIRKIIEANYLCDDLGLDTINTGSTVAFLKECVERGILDYEIRDISDVIRKIAMREDIGDLLAEGTRIAAEKIGARDLSVDVMGMNLPAYDPRVLRGMTFSYILPRFGCHLKAWTAGEELRMSVEKRISAKGKAEFALRLAMDRAWIDSTCVCSFIGIEPKEAAEALSILGIEFDVKKLREVGRRILRTEIEINEIRGIRIRDVEFPKRLLEEETEIDGVRVKIGRDEFERMKEEFCRLIDEVVFDFRKNA